MQVFSILSLDKEHNLLEIRIVFSYRTCAGSGISLSPASLSFFEGSVPVSLFPHSQVFIDLS